MGVEASDIPQWLFDQSYAFAVGDLAETISLLLPNAKVKSEYSCPKLPVSLAIRK